MSDPYTIDTIDKLFNLLNQGDFRTEFMQGNADLQTELRDHQMANGGNPKGSITAKIEYQLQKSGDVAITGKITIKMPEQPAAAGVAYSDGEGQLTLASPMMRRMDVRDPAPMKPTAIK